MSDRGGVQQLEARIAELEARVTGGSAAGRFVSAFSSGNCTNGCTGVCTDDCTHTCTGGCVADSQVQVQSIRAQIEGGG
jgi:hypothetical protein